MSAETALEPVPAAKGGRGHKAPVPDRTTLIERLRDLQVPDETIAAAFGISHQRVHQAAGPRRFGQFEELGGILVASDWKRTKEFAGDFPTFLKDWRRRNRVSLYKAAALCGIHHMAWWKWENGRSACAMPVLLTRYLIAIDGKSPSKLDTSRLEMKNNMESEIIRKNG